MKNVKVNVNLSILAIKSSVKFDITIMNFGIKNKIT